MRVALWLVAGWMALLYAAPLHAVELPPGHQALLLLRTLAYDRNLKARAGKTVTIVVVYNEDDQLSELSQMDILSALNESAESLLVSGLPVRAISVAYHSAAALDAALAGAHASAVYLCSGLSQAGAISAITRRRAILSSTGTARYLASGIAIGFVGRDDRSVLMVNLTAVRAEGASLNASLLRFAELVNEQESK